MESIYKLSEKAKYLKSILEEGEINPEIENELIINQNEIQEKSINYGYIIKSFENDISAIDEELKRLQSIKKQRENNISLMKERIYNALEIYNIEKVNSPTLNVLIRNNPESVEVVNEYQIPEKYRKEKITISLDKIKIKNDLKEGKDVPGAILKQTKRIEIK